MCQVMNIVSFHYDLSVAGYRRLLFDLYNVCFSLDAEFCCNFVTKFEVALYLYPEYGYIRLFCK